MTFRGQFLRFCAVGTVGFVLDAGVLHLLLAAGWAGPYLGRVASYLVAATTTWLLNRRFTFPRSGAPRRPGEWARYVGWNAVGGGVNYATYAAALGCLAAARRWPALGVAAGSAAGLAVNFAASKWLVFGAPAPAPDGRGTPVSGGGGAPL